MERINGYEEAKAYTDAEKLPAGGYVVKILDVNELVYDWGKVLAISFDITEGEYTDFYKNNYKMQQQEDKKWKGIYRLNVPKGDGSEKDGWTMRTFKTATEAVEDSNAGYHWDWNEKGLKGKTVGALFRNKEYEYEGSTGFFTECCGFRPVEVIRENKFKMPKDKLLKNKTSTASSVFEIDGYEPVDSDDDLPF